MDSNKWNQRYQQDQFFYGTEPNDFLKANAHYIPKGGRVLCLAEGEGRNAVYLATLGYEVTAVDGSSVGLEKLKKLAKEKGVSVKTIVSDLAEFKIEPNHWAGIVSIWCHVPPTLRKILHQHVVDGLQSGGYFILESYHPRQLEFKTGGPADPALMMTKSSLESELVGLKIDLVHEIERRIQEGQGHQGPSAVTQFLGHKS